MDQNSTCQAIHLAAKRPTRPYFRGLQEQKQPVLRPSDIPAAKPPNIAWLSLERQTLFILLAALASVLMFFRALLWQMNTPP